MIAVCIIGVLASVALPTYSRFMMMAKSSEAMNDLDSLGKGAIAYWNRPITEKGMAAASVGRCVVIPPGAGSQMLPPLPPTPEKRTADFAHQSEFVALGFSKPDPGYFTLGWVLPRGSAMNGGLTMNTQIPDFCAADGVLADNELIYAFLAISDLDGDGMWGGYHLLLTHRDGELVRASLAQGVLNWDPMYAAMCPTCQDGVD